MAQNVTLYNLLISCPGDIKGEVALIESAVDEFNELYADPLGITIRTRHWSKSSYAQSGGKPQALLNEQFVNRCDAAVAIFWTRFGSPTDEYGSGTEEEIEIMLQSGKQVFMYFSDKPISPSQMNDEGFKKIQANNAFFAGFTSPVDIDEEEREFITTVAEQMKLELSDNFFDLGNLGKDPLSISMYGGLKLKGNSEEINKYRKIKKLRETISEALKWGSVEKVFSDMHCLRLAVQNCGKAIDEDVEITFEIPQKALLILAEFPQFENDEMGYLLNNCDMRVLFGIDSTAEYIKYSKSEKNHFVDYIPIPHELSGYDSSYSDDFIEELNNVFCYLIYSNDDKYIVKLKVDYIKHNTTVAFPSVLFVKDRIIEIPYKITATNKRQN
ncbi:hypothetical protein D7X98_07455 [bacterium 1XD8-76]|nr:hypothetical protein D7X98_07455 [bacterium 1XD8-76]